MNIEFDAYKQKLNDCRPALDGLADSLNLEGMRNELERLHAMQKHPVSGTTGEEPEDRCQDPPDREQDRAL